MNGNMIIFFIFVLLVIYFLYKLSKTNTETSKTTEPEQELSIYQKGEEAAKQRIFQALGIDYRKMKPGNMRKSDIPGTYSQAWTDANCNNLVIFNWYDSKREPDCVGMIPSYCEDCSVIYAPDGSMPMIYDIKNPWSSQMEVYVRIMPN